MIQMCIVCDTHFMDISIKNTLNLHTLINLL